MNASVLVTAAGSIVAQGIIKSLKLAGSGRYTVIAADMSPLAAGLYRCERGVLVPSVSSTADYIESIIKVCNDNDVKAIFCGSDDELLVLANAKGEIQGRTDAKLLTGSASALAIARDKWATYEFCRANGLPCAPSSLPEEREEFVKEFGFPIVVKPREGYGSIHFYIANNREEVEAAIAAIEKAGWRPIVQKYLPGEEFTTGVTIDKNLRHVMSSISIKKIIKHGQTYKAFIDDYRSIRRSAEEVALKLGTSGSVNIQAKLEGDSPVVFEINPRFSATCPMRAIAGVNEPDIVFRNLVTGEEVKVDSYQRLVCMRYWNEVYLPYRLYEKASQGKIEKGSFVPDYF
ncbi:MAG TPA: ATP-grasp domain-containing protein [Nitrososphaera sp.]|jgi:carbamoyl-phosphate synthase large subunit